MTGPGESNGIDAIEDHQEDLEVLAETDLPASRIAEALLEVIK